MRFYLYLGRWLGVPAGVSFSPRELRGAAPRAAAAADAVYVLERADGQTKVGRTGDPKRRRANLQTGSALPLTYKCVLYPRGATAAQVEDKAHELLAPWHMSGDWFAVDPDLAAATLYLAAKQIGASLDPAPACTGEGNGWFPRGVVPTWYVYFAIIVAALVMYYAWAWIDAANLGTAYNP